MDSLIVSRIYDVANSISDNGLASYLSEIPRKIHTNQDILTRVEDSEGRKSMLKLSEGISYPYGFMKFEDATNKVASDTVFTITKVDDNVTYTYTGTGTNPGINNSIAIGTEIEINSSQLDNNNNGLFVITSITTNAFTVINPNGVAESTIALGADSYLRIYTPVKENTIQALI